MTAPGSGRAPAPADQDRVGLVVVSHSDRIAEGTRELAAQAAGPGVRIEAAGGLADGTLGTDALRIADAIRAAAGAAGGAEVVVLVDLGSAVLATATALELLGDPPGVRVSRGPLVEGAVLAAVQASTGSPLDEVLAAADAAAGLPKT